MKLSEVIAAFLAWASKSLAKGTVAGYRHYLESFELDAGDQAVELLKPHHLMSWGSTWHQIQAVQRCFSWAADEAELIPRNPFSRIKRPPLGQRRRTLQRAELVKLLRAAATDFRLFILAARETIARPQELRAMCWEHLRHDPGRGELAGELRAGRCVIVLEEFKGRARRIDTNAVRVIPITPRLGRSLARLAQIAGTLAGPILKTCRGKPWTKEMVRMRMRRLRKRTGLGADHRGEKVCCYTLRHTGGTEAAAAGVRDRVLAELMGHTSTRTTARYQHLEVAHLVDALDQVVKHRKRRRAA